MCVANTELGRNRAKGHRPSEGSYLSNIIGCQLGKGASFSPVGCPMNDTISRILGSRLPPKMSLCAATLVTLTATMRGFMVRSWRCPMRFLTDEAANILGSAIYNHVAISMRIACIRPALALVAFIRENNFLEKTLRFAIHCRSAAKRIAMVEPSHVVPFAPAARSPRLAAAVNDTYTVGFSHSRTSNVRALVRARRRPASLRRVRLLYHIEACAAI